MRILNRIDRLSLGLEGDWKPVGGGVREMRIPEGKEYRVYYAQEGETVVLLLCGVINPVRRRILPKLKNIGGYTMGSVAYKTSDYLKTPEDIAAYIEVAMEDGDERMILLALREAADAIGGMSELARRAGLTREAVYKALGPEGNPRFSSLLAILHAFGLGLGVTLQKAA